MRKSLLTFALLCLAFSSVSSQDTLHSKVPKEGYFLNNFPTEDTVYLIYSEVVADREIRAKFQRCNDTLTIYGIAAAFFNPAFVQSYIGTNGQCYRDPTFDSCIEHLRLFRADTGCLTQIGEDLTIHIIDTPMNYYWDIQKIWMKPGMPNVPPIPMYERYFSTPQTVVDSFYIGYTSYSYYQIPNHEQYTHSRYGMAPASIGPHNYVFPPYEEPRAEYFNSRWYYWHPPSASPYCSLFFPILTPSPGSAGPGGDNGDSVSVEKSDTWHRMISVSPNPTGGKARILSSFGLTRIEVFSADGRLLYDRSAEGLSADLDVSGWAAAIYHLRIHTPMGTVSRRLIVR